MTFEGTFKHAIDAKGRTSLPARFREVLASAGESSLYVTTDLTEKFLLAFAPKRWEEFKRQVGALPQFSPATRQVVRMVIQPAQLCSFDKLGRILVPPDLREYAGLTDEMVWAGSNDRIEVWSPQGHAQCQQALRTPEATAEILKALGNLL